MGSAVSFCLTAQALDRLLPLHVLIDTDRRVLSAGPTMRRLRPEQTFLGARFLDMFEIRRPPNAVELSEVTRLGKRHLQVVLKDEPRTLFKGHAVEGPDGTILFDFSFGIHVADVVRSYGLTAADFAASDLAVEMLYLVEAKSAAMEESRRVNIRLENALSVAEERATTDALTGLRNRRGLETLISDLISNGVDVGLIRVDLDFFKQVNDRLGHAAGDQVLVHVGQILIDETRITDSVFRVGGDEFVIVAEGLGDRHRLWSAGERIANRFRVPVRIGTDTLRVTASLGATASSFYASPEASKMLEDADRALYRSKANGRGQVTLAPTAYSEDEKSGFSSSKVS